jgi:hypothetical protein
VNVRLGTRKVCDVRTPEQLAQGRAIEQAIADQRLEQCWRERVRANELRRLALQAKPF